MKKKHPLLKLLIAIGIVWVVAVSALVAFFPREKFRKTAEVEATKAAGVPVRIGGLGLSFWPLGVSLRDIQVGDKPKPSPLPFVKIQSLAVGVDLLPLLQKRVSVSYIVVDHPEITVYPLETPPPAKPAPKETAPASSDYAVSLSSLRIIDAEIRVLNPDGSGFVHLGALNETLSASLDKAGVMRLEGELGIGKMAIRLPTGTVGQGLTLSFKKKLALDLKNERLTVERGDVSLGDLPLSLTGSAGGWSADKMDVDLSIKGGPTNVKSILGYLPAGMFPEIDGISSQGILGIEAFVKGKVDAKEGAMASLERRELDFSAKLSLKDGRLAYPQLPKPVEGIELLVEATPDHINLLSFAARTDLSQVAVSGKVAHYLATPALDIKAKVNADLKEAQSMQPKGSKATYAGKIVVDASVKGTAEKPSVSGQVQLQSIGYEDPALGLPALRQLSGAMLLNNDLILIRNVSGQIGRSDFQIQGKLADFGGFASTSATKRKPNFEFAMQSANLDLDELMPKSNEPAPAETGATDLSPIRQVNGTVQLAAQKAVFNKLTLKNVVGKATLRDGVFDLKQFSMAVFGGGIRVSGLANLQNPKRTTFDLRLGIQKIQAGDLLDYASNLNQFGHLAGSLTSGLTTDISFKGALDEAMNLDMNRLASAGTLEMTDTVIKNHPIQTKLSSMLDASALKSLSFAKWSVPYEIDAGKLSLKNLKFANKDLGVNLNGTQSIDGTSKMALDVDLPQKWAQGIKTSLPAATQKLLFDGGDGKIQLPLLLTGQITSPSIALDQGKVRSSLGARAQEKATDEAKKATGKAADKILKGKKKEDLKKSLKKLF